jgi:hypothetical protein
MVRSGVSPQSGERGGGPGGGGTQRDSVRITRLLQAERFRRGLPRRKVHRYISLCPATSDLAPPCFPAPVPERAERRKNGGSDPPFSLRLA